MVEAIAKQSQNVAWSITLDGVKQKHRRIRRVSLDKFYKTITGHDDAFFKLCRVLPTVIEDIVNKSDEIKVPHDTVTDELNALAKQAGGSFVMALFMLGFATYDGFTKG